MSSILQYRNGRPDHRVTAPVYRAALWKLGWDVVHWQVLTELADWLTCHRQDLSPRQRVEWADQWQQSLLTAVASAGWAGDQPSLAAVEAMFCQVFGVLGHALVAQQHQDKLVQAVRRADAIIRRVQSKRRHRA